MFILSHPNQILIENLIEEALIRLENRDIRAHYE